MKRKPVSKKPLWIILILVLLILLFRLIDNTISFFIGKGAQIFLLIVVVILILWLIGNKK